MNNRKRTNGNKRKRINTVFDKVSLVPIIAALSVIPLIVYVKNVKTNLEVYDWRGSSEYTFDAFLYYKGLSLIIMTILSVFTVCWIVYKKKESIKKSLVFIPITLYAALTVLSAIFSEYSYFAFHGISTQLESVWVQLSYCVLAYYTFFILHSEKQLHTIINWLTAGVTVMCAIGVFQALGYDLYSSKLGSYLIIPPSLWDVLSIDKIFEKGRVYLSLQNPNYVGSYVVLLLPLFVVLLLFRKKKSQLITYGLIIAALFVCLYKSESRSGIFILFISMFVLALLFRKILFKQWKIIIAILGVCATVFIIINYASNNILFEKLAIAFSEDRQRYSLSEIQTNDDNITIVYKDKTVIVQFMYENQYEYGFLVTDENGEGISIYADDERILYFEDEYLKNITIQAAMMGEYPGFQVLIDGYDWNFTNQIDGTYHYYTPVGKFVKINNNAPSIGFEGKEFFASRRGFIWSRTFPMLQDSIFLGTGADTYAFYFPNTDFVAMYNNTRDPGEVIMKPHNLYLQIAVQNGIIALVAFLVFYGIYFVWCIRIYWRSKFDSYMSQTGAGIFAGTIGYMLISMANDSNVTVTPIFWVLMGLGFAINYKLWTEKKGEAEIIVSKISNKNAVNKK